jgi:hypothetical protein
MSGQPTSAVTGTSCPVKFADSPDGHEGQVTVARSFTVQGGHTPAVAIVVGAISCQAMQTEVRLDFPGLGDSYITPMSNNIPGRINFNYTPQWEVLA